MAGVAFDHVLLIAMNQGMRLHNLMTGLAIATGFRMALSAAEPRFIVQTNDVDDQGIAFPVADGIAQEGAVEVLRMAATIGVNDAIGLADKVGFVQGDHHLGSLHKLQRHHGGSRNTHGLAIVLRIVRRAGAILIFEDGLNFGGVFGLIRRHLRYGPLVVIGDSTAAENERHRTVGTLRYHCIKRIVIEAGQVRVTIGGAWRRFLGNRQPQIELLQFLIRGATTRHVNSRGVAFVSAGRFRAGLLALRSCGHGQQATRHQGCKGCSRKKPVSDEMPFCIHRFSTPRDLQRESNSPVNNGWMLFLRRRVCQL